METQEVKINPIEEARMLVKKDMEEREKKFQEELKVLCEKYQIKLDVFAQIIIQAV